MHELRLLELIPEVHAHQGRACKRLCGDHDGMVRVRVNGRFVCFVAAKMATWLPTVRPFVPHASGHCGSISVISSSRALSIPFTPLPNVSLAPLLLAIMMVHAPIPKPHRYRSNAPPPQTPGPPPNEPLPVPPPLAFDDDFSDTDSLHDTWADEAKRFATLRGALALSSDALKALRAVPRDSRDSKLLPATGQPLTRTRSLIIAGQRVEFAFATGGRALRRHGMPMYALANASEEELCKNMTGGRDQIGAVWQLRRIRVRFEVRRAALSGCRWL